MPKATLAAIFASLLALVPTPSAVAYGETALDRYVAAADPAYRYELVTTIPGDGYTAHVLDMTSQQWRSAREVDKPLWRHWLTIVRPERVETRIGVLVIGGGSTASRPPARINPLLTSLAVMTRSVVSEVRMVPNQPLTFAEEEMPRSEDAIIAYSWEKYLRTGDETWPLRLPMTKSAVRAMDAVTAFCASPQGGATVVDRFVVGGRSKRGWTAWTTAAVDKRVVAIVPMVIDMLNIEPSIEHHYRAYGRWASALGPYQEAGLMQWLGTAQSRELLAIEDPYAYRDRLTMPKMIVNSTGISIFCRTLRSSTSMACRARPICAMCRTPTIHCAVRTRQRVASPSANRSSPAWSGRDLSGASKRTDRSVSGRRRSLRSCDCGRRPT